MHEVYLDVFISRLCRNKGFSKYWIQQSCAMLFFCWQNAMRAVVEYHHKEIKVPKLKVMVCKGEEDVTIRVSYTSIF